MEFREILRKERLSRGWTYKEMGEKLYRSGNAIYHYEKGNRTIDSDTLNLIANIFNYEWKKKEEEELITTMETKRYYTEKQYVEYKHMKQQWMDDHDESDIMSLIEWKWEKEKWMIKQDLSEEATEQMDERMDYEETEQLIALYLDVKDSITTDKHFEEFSSKENDLVDECNRLVDELERCAEDGEYSNYQMVENQIREIEAELDALRQDVWDTCHLELLRMRG